MKTVYEAIEEMRSKSERREEFAFSYMSYSITRDNSEGEVCQCWQPLIMTYNHEPLILN